MLSLKQWQLSPWMTNIYAHILTTKIFLNTGSIDRFY